MVNYVLTSSGTHCAAIHALRKSSSRSRRKRRANNAAREAPAISSPSAPVGLNSTSGPSPTDARKARNSVARNFWNLVVGVREFDRSLTERCEPFVLGDYLRQARNTTVQVRTVEEGFGIGSEFRQICCAANNFRNHEVLFVQVLQFRLKPDTILTRRMMRYAASLRVTRGS